MLMILPRSHNFTEHRTLLLAPVFQKVPTTLSHKNEVFLIGSLLL